MSKRKPGLVAKTRSPSESIDIIKKHPGGRPTKYEGQETIDQIDKIISMLDDKPQRFLEFCGVDQVAHYLHVNTDTIYEWRNVHPEFSVAIKKWETCRNAHLYQVARALPPAIWIFMCKNILHWRDQTDINHSGKVKNENKLIIEVVQTKPESAEKKP